MSPSRSLLSRLVLIVEVIVISTVAALPLAAALPSGNVVQQWNKIAEDTVVGAGAFQNEGLIYMAYESAAVYNAVIAIEGGYEPYRSGVTANPGASVDAAVIEAAYTTLRDYFPSQAGSLDALHDEDCPLFRTDQRSRTARPSGRLRQKASSDFGCWMGTSHRSASARYSQPRQQDLASGV